MDPHTRAESVAARLRRWRVRVLAALVAGFTISNLLHTAHSWWKVVIPLVAVIFWYLPGAETVVRNFRRGYREVR